MLSPTNTEELENKYFLEKALFAENIVAFSMCS